MALRDALMLEEFRSRVDVIRGKEAAQLRRDYIDQFVSTETEIYQASIAPATLPDGVGTYTGYLWDTLKRPEFIAEGDLLVELMKWGRCIVFWDLHDETKVHVPDYWKFPRDSMIRARSEDVARALQYDWETADVPWAILPEDIYIYEPGQPVSLVATHELWPDDRSERQTFGPRIRMKACADA